jgi:Domain of unknown function (DUF4440)
MTRPDDAEAPTLEELVDLETARTRSWLERDKERLAALLDADFVEINYFGRLTRHEILDDLFARLRLVALEPSDYLLLPAGRDAAMLTYRCDETIAIDGRTMSGSFHVGALYVRQGGAWRLRSWQITPCQA